MNDLIVEIERIEGGLRIENGSEPKPRKVCVAPWVLQRRGTWLSEWCQDEKNVFVGCGSTLPEYLLGPDLYLLPYKKRKWIYYGDFPTYRKFVRKMWMKNMLQELSGKNLGCFCTQKRKSNGCPLPFLLQQWKKKEKTGKKLLCKSKA